MTSTELAIDNELSGQIPASGAAALLLVEGKIVWWQPFDPDEPGHTPMSPQRAGEVASRMWSPSTLGVGNVYDPSTQATYAAPNLHADPLSISVSGSSVVTYRNEMPGAPLEIVMSANGKNSDPIPLSGGEAILEVVASGPGDITIECQGHVLTIEVVA